MNPQIKEGGELAAAGSLIWWWWIRRRTRSHRRHTHTPPPLPLPSHPHTLTHSEDGFLFGLHSLLRFDYSLCWLRYSPGSTRWPPSGELGQSLRIPEGSPRARLLTIWVHSQPMTAQSQRGTDPMEATFNRIWLVAAVVEPKRPMAAHQLQQTKLYDIWITFNIMLNDIIKIYKKEWESIIIKITDKYQSITNNIIVDG